MFTFKYFSNINLVQWNLFSTFTNMIMLLHVKRLIYKLDIFVYNIAPTK